MSKNIVLLSDGTGNSAAKPFKTNVWRLYQALDTRPNPGNGARRQIAYYDGGVGSGNFKPLALLGSAFGIGVWRNVRDRYDICVWFQSRCVHRSAAGRNDRPMRANRSRQRG